MTPAEAAALLTIAAAYDNRKPDADQAKAWAMALEDLRFEDCRDAIVAHYRKTRDWLMPVEVINGVRQIRTDRLRRFTGSFTPPSELADDPEAEFAWIADRKRRVGNGEPVEDVVTPPAVRTRSLAELGLTGRRIPRDGE